MNIVYEIVIEIYCLYYNYKQILYILTNLLNCTLMLLCNVFVCTFFFKH